MQLYSKTQEVDSTSEGWVEMDAPGRSQTCNHAFEQILHRYYQAAERDQAPTREDFIAEHPEYTEQLHAFFDDLQQFPGTAVLLVRRCVHWVGGGALQHDIGTGGGRSAMLQHVSTCSVRKRLVFLSGCAVDHRFRLARASAVGRLNASTALRPA